MKNIAIGKSDFKSLIEGNYYYVDKTLFIKEIINGADVSLITRPRRFGKTLNLSMLEYFFDVNNDTKHIFKGLNIQKEEEFKHLNQYPVIFLTFKDIKSNNFDECMQNIYSEINSTIYFKEDELKKYKDSLNNEEYFVLENIMNNKASKLEYKKFLKVYSKFLYLKHNKEVVILIDEYDTPIHYAYTKGYYQDLIDFLRDFLSAGFKDNKYLFRGVMTGILRVAKESIFSGLNNLGVYTLLDDKFSDKFGFTIDETKKFLEDYGLIDKFEIVMNNYNGYTIGEEIILNPWSIINYIADGGKYPKLYWANTSSNELIKDLISKSSLTFKKNLENFVQNKVVKHIEIDTNIVFAELDRNDVYIYSLLFFAGYLKCVNKYIDIESAGEVYCDLLPTNKEVLVIYKKIILSWLRDSYRNEDLEVLLNALINLDIKMFERMLSDFILKFLSYYDTAKNIEAVYHAFLLGLLVSLNDYEIISNSESGYGRFDIMILHKKDTSKPVIIMELKTLDEFEEETKDKALNSALKQIEEKQYETLPQKRGYKNIYKLAVVFDGKRVWVKRG